MCQQCRFANIQADMWLTSVQFLNRFAEMDPRGAPETCLIAQWSYPNGALGSGDAVEGDRPRVHPPRRGQPLLSLCGGQRCQDFFTVLLRLDPGPDLGDFALWIDEESIPLRYSRRGA